ncbi:MAG TPA: enoyl-CoA hydratase/isomerase family protein, partial [Actinomycetota bacterium]|nr:enoyl-CoA hydratase/isomerase family protein [Actinomycetota bacterium]
MREFVNLEVGASGVATLRLDRPKMNALNQQVARAIGAARTGDAAAARQ